MAEDKIYAPLLPSSAVWLNTTRPLTAEDLRGRVVLLDFWTYCCINCLHLLPDLKYLEEKYRNEPFLVIGVHSAKFANERNVDNIRAAVQRYEIGHPVIVDEGRTIWNAFTISAWPTLILLDSEGVIRGEVSGEGHRQLLDLSIEGLLNEGREKGTLNPEPLKMIKKEATLPTTLSFPGKITLDDEGKRIFISDTNHNRVLVCHFHHEAMEAHILQTVGSGQAGKTDGDFKEASFYHPQGLCLVEENLYVCDTDNHLIRWIDLESQTVETLAGTGEQARGAVTGGEGRQVALNSPWDLDYADGYLYLAMAGAHQIWSLRLFDNFLEVFAGSGLENLVDGDLEAAQLAQPSGVSIRGKDLYFVDSEASALRKINFETAEVETLVGSGLFDFGYRNGSFGYAFLQHPLGLFADEKAVFIADTYNNAIRQANLESREITTLVGQQGEREVCTIGDRACAALPLFEPSGVWREKDFLFIADTNNHLIRVFNLKTLTLSDLRLVVDPSGGQPGAIYGVLTGS